MTHQRASPFGIDAGTAKEQELSQIIFGLCSHQLLTEFLTNGYRYLFGN